MAQTTKTFSFTTELDKALNILVFDLIQSKTYKNISKSKVVRIAVAEYLEKLSRIKKINKGDFLNLRTRKNE